MAISASMSRFAAYYKRHGIGAIVRRAALAAKRALFSSEMVLLYCDLAEGTARPEDSEGFVKVELKTGCAEVSQQDFQTMTSFWNPKLAKRNINERFAKGALLWLIKSEDRLAGYGWTLRGGTIEPHYVPLGHNDVHLFDFHVFPKYRGRGMNPSLVNYILHRMAADGKGRAFIEAAEWNQTQLSSLGKTPFHRYGRARKWTIFAHTIVCWTRNDTLQQGQRDSGETSSTVAAPENVQSSRLNSTVF